MARELPTNESLQKQIDDLLAQVAAARTDITGLQRRADTSDQRADASQDRADAIELRADLAEARADKSDLRLDDIETRAMVDRDMIAELQRDGILSQKHAQEMEEALKSSRIIGAAMGIIMGSRNVTQDEAFAVLQKASANSNRKLRELAKELVDSAGRQS
ncbi:MAG TPA: ANTAR domain-containing protein [Nocardioidaceae bacterium]|nr:ANTAR domain-containing protein [Nocardioidaceae bacterium]